MQQEYHKKIGDYVLKKFIGSGAFATVYKATNSLTNETFAIKMISKSDMNSRKLESIEREISILRSFSHPNIISIKDFKKTRNNLYLIFEYCSNGDLESYLSKHYIRKMPEKDVKTIVSQLIEALKKLKEKQIVHRDLKLANILLSNDMKVKIADFGFAKSLGSIDYLQSYCGTPITMAPEILNKNENYNEKCDIWSLGVIIYKLLFGKYPFYPKENTLEELKNEVNKGQLIFPIEIQISEEAKNLIKSMLCVDQEKRIGFDELFKNEWIYPKKKERILENNKEFENDIESIHKNEIEEGKMNHPIYERKQSEEQERIEFHFQFHLYNYVKRKIIEYGQKTFELNLKVRKIIKETKFFQKPEFSASEFLFGILLLEKIEDFFEMTIILKFLKSEQICKMEEFFPNTESNSILEGIKKQFHEIHHLIRKSAETIEKDYRFNELLNVGLLKMSKIFIFSLFCFCYLLIYVFIENSRDNNRSRIYIG